MCQNCPTTPINTLSFHRDVVLEAIKDDEDFLKGDYHQALLNICYSEWQKNSVDMEYGDMIAFAEKTYGELVAFAVLIGKYNQQVCNGGHAQYYDNGYASGEGGFATNHGDDTSMHDLLLSYFLRIETLQKFEWYGEMKDILEKFLKFSIDTEENYEESCSECYGDGEVEEETDSDEDEEDSEPHMITCPSCWGSGREDVSNPDYNSPVGHEWSNLDDRYYKINDEVQKDLEIYFKIKIR